MDPCKYEAVITNHTEELKSIRSTIESWRPYMNKLVLIVAVLGFLASAGVNRLIDAVSPPSAAAATPAAQATAAAATKSELRELIKEAAAEYIKAQAAEVRVSAKTVTASSPDANMSNP